jgi:hypothetical protein
VPFATFDVVKVAQDHEDPSHLEKVSQSYCQQELSLTYGKAKPPNKAVVLLKHIVVGTSQAVSHRQRFGDLIVLTCESKGKRSRQK